VKENAPEAVGTPVIDPSNQLIANPAGRDPALMEYLYEEGYPPLAEHDPV
jgi:hypothetical protein